jgi:hypothetical protein
MCFSPGADLVVGGIVVGIGVDALRHVREPKQILVASLPLMFGLHQVDEAFVWLGLQGHVSESLERVGIWVYVLFALAVVPALVPLAVVLVERAGARRRIIGVMAALGVTIGVSLGVSIFRGSVNAVIEGRHIAYDVSALQRGGQITALYVLAACGALVFSSHRDLSLIGVLNLSAVPVLMWMTVNGFISLWCFWAAIVSVLIDVHLRKQVRRSALVSTFRERAVETQRT